MKLNENCKDKSRLNELCLAGAKRRGDEEEEVGVPRRRNKWV